MKWIGLGAALELLSMLGFVLVFALVFGAGMGWRRKLGTGLRALGASTALPAGGLVGPAMAASAGSGDEAPAALITSTIAFTILTNAPGVIVLGALGFILSLGWPTGPHSVLLTLPAAALPWAVIGAWWLIAGSSARSGSRTDHSRPAGWRQIVVARAVVREGTEEARRILAAGSWKLAGAVGYYAFDNAVLWAAFRAYGHSPPISVIVMGYLVGSLGGLLPLPAGIGAVEGGLIGALVLYGAPAAPAAGAVLLYRGLSLALPLTFGAAAWALIPAARLRNPRARTGRRPGALAAPRAPGVPSRAS